MYTVSIGLTGDKRGIIMYWLTVYGLYVYTRVYIHTCMHVDYLKNASKRPFTLNNDPVQRKQNCSTSTG